MNEVIVLTQNGIWLADGTEITHEPTRKLFARSLKKDSEGYFLHIGRETKRIQVEDTAYFVIRIEGDLKNGYELWINDETRERLDPNTLRYSQQSISGKVSGRLTCDIKMVSDTVKEEAKFLHAAYSDLLSNLQEDSDGYYLEFGTGSQSHRIVLGRKK